MKKYQCLVCGWDINEDSSVCPNCNSSIDMDIITDQDKIKSLKYKVKNNINSLNFKENISLLDNIDNNLLLEYYKMYCYKVLKKEYNEDLFFNTNYKYSNEELDEVILHILEHYQLFKKDNINLIISKSNNKNKYLAIINSIYSDDYQKPIEKELRELLFNKVSIPQTKKFNANKEEGKALLYLSLVLFIVFIAAVLIFVGKDIKTPMMYLALIAPTFTLSKALTKIIFIKNNLLINILSFIILFYLVTFIYYLFINGFTNISFVDHIKEVIKSPSDIIKLLIERMSEQNEI